MRILKRCTALILCALLVLPNAVFARFADVDTNSDSVLYDSVSALYRLGVVNGDENGNFNPQNNITRAEFAKIAVKVANCDYVYSSSGLFGDLAEGYWANGYINTAAKNRLIMGYPDGTFMPEQSITYAEVCTVALRLLGYGTDELGADYPNAYMSKAVELKLTDAYTNAYAAATRGDVAKIIYNALFCDMNSDSSKKYMLVTKMNYNVSDECVILAAASENSALKQDEIYTTAGTYTCDAETLGDDYIGAYAKLVYNSDGKVAEILKYPRTHKRIVADSVAGNDIIYTQDGAKQTYTMQGSALVYYNCAAYVYNDVKDNITSQTVIDIYYKDGKYDYAVLNEYEMKGPAVLYTDTDRQSYPDAERIVRDGKQAKRSDLKTYDVLYYNEYSKTLYAYCDTVSGVYDEAYPNKENPTSVKIGGKTYKLGSQNAVKSLGEYENSYSYNDYVTCLLGKDNDIVAVMSKQSGTSASNNAGVVISSYSKIDNGTQKYYISCINTNGTQTEFETKKSCSDFVGKVVKYSFDGGRCTPTSVNASPIYGNVDKTAKTIGSRALSSNAKLIDILYAPKKGSNTDAIAQTVELADIPKNTIAKSDVAYAITNSKGEIESMIFNNVTKLGYSFGIVTEVQKLSSNSTYKIDINGNENTYNVSFVVNNISKGTPVMACINNGQLLSVYSIADNKVSGKVEYIDGSRITVDGKDYTVAKDAVFYNINSDYTHSVISVDDIEKENISQASFYFDSAVSSGAQVRMGVMKIK